MNARRHAPGLLAASLFVLLTGGRALADYPIVSHRYLADPGSLVYKGRVYLYNSNDDDNAVGGGYAMHSVVCVSSADMKNWTDHGVVFQVPADASWAGNSWAPQPIERNGTIYLYFGNSGSGIGVASSTDPAGKFKDANGGYLVNGSTAGACSGCWLFDPGAFIDDDGSAYLSFGGNGQGFARIIKLGSNLTSVSGSAVPPMTTVKGFFEASFLFKRNGVYYFSYSTDSANGLRIDYLRSSSPMSGWAYGGVVAGQPPSNNNNNHASQFELGGKWYHAYHNRIVASQAGISTTYKRNLAIETLDFNADGSIKQVAYTIDGVPQVGALDPYKRVEAETTNAQSGIETEPCSEGGMDVTQISTGDWVKVRGVDFGSGARSFSARVASTSTGGSIELRLGSTAGTLVGTCSVPNTGGAQTWATTTCDVTGATGKSDLVLKFTGSFNFNYWQFTSANSGSGSNGSGGAPGSGGTAGSGGIGGVTGGGGLTGGGGATGAGGGVTGAGGATAGSGDTTGHDADGAGCSCRVGHEGGWLMVLLPGIAIASRRRHRRRNGDGMNATV